jgi:hypothetical protein
MNNSSKKPKKTTLEKRSQHQKEKNKRNQKRSTKEASIKTNQSIKEKGKIIEK